MGIKIGVLLPRSDMFPRLAVNFLNGLKLTFDQAGEEHVPQLLIESIGNASDKEVLQRIEKMILQEDPQLIVGFCSYFLLDKMIAVANSYQKPLIHLSLGGRVLKEEHKNPYVLYQSLNLVQSCYLSGKLAAQTLGGKGALLASFYDGAYHMAEAFVRGFKDFGGEMVYNYVSQMDYRQDDFRSMTEGIAQTKPEVLLSLFSYKEAERVFQVMANPAFESSKVMALPLMVDESIALEREYPLETLSLASWTFGQQEGAMADFEAAYQSAYEEKPNIFSLLGYEVGLLLAQTLQEQGEIPKQIGSYMADKTLASPRGELRYTELYESIPIAFEVRRLSSQDGHCHNGLTGRMEAKESEIIYKKMGSIPDVGWRNPYICT